MDRASGLLTIVGIAGAAAAASVAGGLIALWRPPGTLFLSLALGFAGGVLLATVTFEMLPTALERGSLPLVTGGFLLGMLAVYGFDLYVHRGRLAGDKSAERDTVRRFHRRRRPRGDEVTVLAGGTSVEELIEGLSIGVGSAIAPGTGLLIGIAIAIDNLGESLSIGELIRSESGEPDRAMRPADPGLDRPDRCRGARLRARRLVPAARAQGSPAGIPPRARCRRHVLPDHDRPAPGGAATAVPAIRRARGRRGVPGHFRAGAAHLRPLAPACNLASDRHLS